MAAGITSLEEIRDLPLVVSPLYPRSREDEAEIAAQRVRADARKSQLLGTREEMGVVEINRDRESGSKPLLEDIN
jgi:hypothetical protein